MPSARPAFSRWARVEPPGPAGADKIRWTGASPPGSFTLMPATRLSRVTWLLIIGNAVSSLGTGLVLPLTLIYLHQVRHIALPAVGVLLTASGAIGLVSVPYSGIMLDRFGARRVLAVLLVIQALGEAGIAWAHDVRTAVPAVVLLGISIAATFPAFQTMLAGLNPDPARQQRAFAVNFTGLNATIGIGGAIGAAVASVGHPASFQVLFLANGMTCVLFALIASRLPNVRAAHEAQAPKAGYREVLAIRPLRTVLAATLVLAFTGYAALDSGLPAYGTVEAHVSVRVVALSITINTGVIVISQLFVLRLVRRLRRSRSLVMIGLVWSIAWAIFGASALPLAPGVRVACVLAFNGLFGFGETFMAPTVSPLVNSLAGDRIRGRANALSSVAYSVAFVVSPAICTGMIAAGLAALWIALLSVGCFGTILLALRLGRQLTGQQDRLDPRGAQLPEPAVV